MVSNEEDARDLAQEVFIRAFNALSSFDTKRSFLNWVLKIASNLCIDFYRRSKLKTVSLDQELEEGDGRRLQLSDERAGPEESAQSDETLRALDKAIRKLPPKYKMVILLRHKNELSYEEISETLDLPTGTVKARIHRGHRALREILEQDGFSITPAS
jgi:RNA polymerase sigma-70 factor (ECF subfamily)